jgi:hypothetical protein
MEFNDRLTVGIAAIAIVLFACALGCGSDKVDTVPAAAAAAAAVEARPLYYTVRVVIPHDTVSICTDFIPTHGATIQADQITGTVVSVRPLNLSGL